MLSVQDKLALMMTAARSQRQLSSFTGISHQRIGRWLRYGFEGGAKNLPTDPVIISAIDSAFEIYREVCRDQAIVDGLHFNANYPVFAHRLLRQKRERFVTSDGEIHYRPLFDSRGRPIMEKGDRVSMGFTHWLSNELRDKIIAGAQRSNKYYHVSVGSMVNLQIYNKRSEERMRGKRRTPEQLKYKKQFQKRLRLGEQTGWVFTQYEYSKADTPTDLMLNNIADRLRERHEPACNVPGTALAAQILLQVDTREKSKPRGNFRTRRGRK